MGDDPLRDGGQEGPSVASLVLEALAGAGAETVFGLPGVHNLAFWSGAGGKASPRLVSVRHEQTAVYAADGWARASGRLGAALVTTGPGAANTLGAFGEAAMSRSPLVLVASEVPRAVAKARMRRALHQSRDQAGMFKPLAKAVFSPRSPAEVSRDLSLAVGCALSVPQGPVYVDIPSDVLGVTGVTVPPPAPEPASPADREVLARVSRLLGPAASVVVWAGGGVVAAGAGADLGALALLLQAPVITTFGSRGVLGPDHPCDVVFPPHEPEVEQMLASADVLLAVGTDFDGAMTKNGALRLPRTIIDINVEPGGAGETYKGAIPVRSDAREALRTLRGIATRHEKGLAGGLPALRGALWYRLRSDPRTAPAAALVELTERVTPPGTVVVNDMTIPGYWLGNYFRPKGPRSVQYPVGWGTLGYALPASVGAAAGTGQRVLAVCGDGGFMFATGELATITQEQLPVTVLLFDDGGYGMLRYGRTTPGRPAPGADLFVPDFVRLADAFGINATRVEGTGAVLEEALRQAVSSGEPRMVVCGAALFPPKTTSPRWAEEI